MKFTEHESWRVSTLSPVHIGCGQDYEPTNFVIADEALYFLDDTAVQEGLSDSDMEALARAAISKGGISKIRRTLNERKDKLKLFASHIVPMHASMAKECEDAIGNDRARMEYCRTAYNPHNHLPYLPASSVKGSIRTALLEHLYRGNIQVDSRELKRGNNRYIRDVNQELQKQALGYDQVDSDPMKLVSISDSAINSSQVPTRLVYALNLRRSKSKDQQAKGPDQRLETLAPGLKDAFQIDISRHCAMKAGRRDNKKDVDLPDQMSLNDIVVATNTYYRRRLENELDRLNDNALLDKPWSDGIRRLLAGELGTALDQGRAMLLRVGRHSGADSVTVDQLEHVYIMKKGDQGNKQYARTPTTDWLVADSKHQTQGLLPFGWMLFKQTKTDLPETDQWLASLGDVQNRYTEHWQKLKEGADSARQEQQEKARVAAEKAEAARKQAEAEEKRIAALSPEQKQIETLIARVSYGEGKNGGAGAQIAVDLKAMIDEAVERWSPQDREALWEAAKSIYSHVGVDIKKNKKAKERMKKLKSA